MIQCPRPTATKLYFLFCFVLHIHFLNHMMAFLSKSWVNSVSWDPTLFLKGSTQSLALGTAQWALPNCSQRPGMFSHPGDKAGKGMDATSSCLTIQTGFEMLQDLSNNLM